MSYIIHINVGVYTAFLETDDTIAIGISFQTTSKGNSPAFDVRNSLSDLEKCQNTLCLQVGCCNAFKLAVAMPLSWLLQCLQIGCCYAFKYAVAMIVCCRRVHIMFNLYRTHVRTLLSAILYLIYLVLQ